MNLEKLPIFGEPDRICGVLWLTVYIYSVNTVIAQE